jgi:hypothetical protein
LQEGDTQVNVRTVYGSALSEVAHMMSQCQVLPTVDNIDAVCIIEGAADSSVLAQASALLPIYRCISR